LAEQYLIRAESRVHGASGGIIGAIDDLNVIRMRADLPPLSYNLSQSEVVQAILQERRIEFFAEFGHRWLDLKRTDNVDSVMQVITPLKGGGQWKSFQQYYPIPYSELLRDPKLKQTPGY
jgi:hypothetical protein